VERKFASLILGIDIYMYQTRTGMAMAAYTTTLFLFPGMQREAYHDMATHGTEASFSWPDLGSAKSTQ
jgi:hypothetical protein